MRLSHIALFCVLCVGTTLAVRVQIKKRDVLYISDGYNSKLEPNDFDYDEELVERVAVDKRGLIYAVGDDRLSILKVGRNRQLRLIHTQKFERDNVDLESVQTCNGLVTVAISFDEFQPIEAGALLIFRAYNKRMRGDLRLIHSVGFDARIEHHQFTKDCKRIIVAVEGGSSIGVVTLGDSIKDEPMLRILGFGSFEPIKDALLDDWLLLPLATPFEEAFDPEWVCLNKKQTMAFVNLKNNNAVAKLDISKPGMETITDVIPYGLKNWADTTDTDGADFSDEPQVAMMSNQPIFSAYNPEQISCITIKNEDCILMAGEGLSSGNSAGLFSDKLQTIDTEDTLDYLQAEAIAGDILVLSDTTDIRIDTDADDDIDKIVTSGSRDFNIRCGDNLALRASTRSDLERLTMGTVLFNVDITNGEHTLAERFDKSSDERGPEPEAVTSILICGGRQLLMLGMTEDPGHLWAFTLDTWDMDAGFQFQDKVHGFKRTDSLLTDKELYQEKQLYLRNAEGIAFLKVEPVFGGYQYVFRPVLPLCRNDNNVENPCMGLSTLDLSCIGGPLVTKYQQLSKPGTRSMSRRNSGTLSIVIGSKVTSTVETYDIRFQCRSSKRRNRHW